ncbi:hypothetical protein PN466_13980 [Roseofilum reptotaenium CS-1145]|uniref:Uncharacterized protein n=1 Tax=Roseofilum reptotaenium AO1-A TaxID=1925591 RepID=A0A1L9QVZ0_9CYAN|nr:hypothetical protein [Roseofilum reptotaenium]MDB9518055.1 hypothetical protein [Roseofilum reptotaenium CS-1145]OJJ26861.1 hypothetical protein BI308_03990 [Roseofilum reptotaenium AO1-A]
MKSHESFSNTLDRANGIHLEIWEPSLIVLPIPERTLPESISFGLWLKLTNQTVKPWKIDADKIIIPELITSDGKILERGLNTDHQKNEANTPYKGDNLVNRVVYSISSLIDDIARRGISWVSPKTAIFISIAAKVCWEKDLLQLQLLTNRCQALNSSCFDALKLGNYQLRFIYESSSNQTKYQPKEGILQLRNVKQRKGDRLTTPFVNLRLVETKPNDKAIEVDGIRFETTLPETVIRLPKKDNGIETSVPIGIRITNNSNTDFYFNFYNTLIPELITLNGEIIKKDYTSDFLKRMLLSDILLAVQGKSIDFFPNAKLLCKKNGKLKLKIAAGDGGDWSFNNLKAGRYWLRLTYKNKSVETRVEDRNAKKIILFKKLWRGMVLGSLVALDL